ncbi:MAG: hypothetical protein ABSF98_23875 [Bryobacteraceae bacterium]|jgi:hypothetical protein
MQNMLAYTIHSAFVAGDYPQVVVGQGTSNKYFGPANPVDDSYWIYFLDRSNPTNSVYQTVVPGADNSSIPAGLMQYLKDENLLFGVVTQTLSTVHVPQGEFYDLLVRYGAGRALQRLEQVNSTLGSGFYGTVSYALVGQGGPRDGGLGPPSYEAGDLHHGVVLTLSLMPGPDGQPPYSIRDSETFPH